MSECSPYIRQAVERCALPIGVAYDPTAELWGITSLDKNSPDHGHWWGDTKSATGDYLDAVKEWTK